MNGKRTVDWKGLLAKLEPYKYVLLVILVGSTLLLLPEGGGDGEERTAPPSAVEGETFDLPAFEARLANTLSRVEGAGKVQVVLTLRDSGRRELAQDVERDEGGGYATSTVTVSGSDRGETVVQVERTAPRFQGALVVCPGGGDPEVQLSISKAVSVLTGLGADKISVCKGG